MSDVCRKLSGDFLPTLKNAVLFWPMVSVVNSAFVPVLSRPMFSSFMGVFWNVYISYQANHNGMEVGEMSVVYPPSQEREQEKVALVAKTATATATATGAAAATATGNAAGKEAVAAAAAAAAVVKRAGAEGGSSVKAPAVAGEAKREADAAPRTEGGDAAPATPPGRKKRGRIVRRTSVVSM